MNKFFVSAFMILFITTAYCQTVTVDKQTEKVKGENIDVYTLTLEGKKDEISSVWNKYLKETGKLRWYTDPMTVSDPIMNGTTYTGKAFYADMKKNNETSFTVWAGINTSDWTGTETDNVNRGLEKLVYQFGVTFYQHKVQVQIDESQQALDAVDKQKQRILNQSKDLTLQLSNNEQEKSQLDKSLEANRLENSALKIKIENNKKAQDSLANVGIQINKVMGAHKEKQKKIN